MVVIINLYVRISTEKCKQCFYIFIKKYRFKMSSCTTENDWLHISLLTNINIIITRIHNLKQTIFLMQYFMSQPKVFNLKYEERVSLHI